MRMKFTEFCAVVGLFRLTRLKVLNVSNRNCVLTRSVIRKFLCRPMS